jgi:small subunit ribosomal protein S9
MNEQTPSEPEQTPSPDAAPAPSATPPAETPAPVTAEAPADNAPPAESIEKATAGAEKAGAEKASAGKASAEKARTEKSRADKAPAPKPGSRKPQVGQWWWGVGRRKSAVARVRIRPGDGKFFVNKRSYDKYLNEERDQNDVMTVLQKTKTVGSVDVHVNVRGGGYTGQAGAIVLGLGRALRKYDESLEPILRDNGFLSRDPRKVERKKYGQPGARRRFQFSKR